MLVELSDDLRDGNRVLVIVKKANGELNVEKKLCADSRKYSSLLFYNQ